MSRLTFKVRISNQIRSGPLDGCHHHGTVTQSPVTRTYYVRNVAIIASVPANRSGPGSHCVMHVGARPGSQLVNFFRSRPVSHSPSRPAGRPGPRQGRGSPGRRHRVPGVEKRSRRPPSRPPCPYRSPPARPGWLSVSTALLAPGQRGVGPTPCTTATVVTTPGPAWEVMRVR